MNCNADRKLDAVARERRILHLRRFVLPVAGVVGGTLALMIGLLMWMAALHDDLARQRETHALHVAIAAKTKILRGTLLDHSLWDETVDHMVWHRDLEWADENLGPYFHRLHGYEHSFVLDGADQTVYSSTNGERSRLDASVVLGRGIWRAVQRLRASGDIGSIEGLGDVGGRIAFFAVAPIMPDPGNIGLPPGPRSHLLITKYLDAALVADLGDQLEVDQLRLTPPGLPGPASLTLGNAAGLKLARLTWTPARPGSTLFFKLLPFLVFVAISAVAVSAAVLRRVRLTAGELEASQTSEVLARHLADHDALTGLPNRRFLLQRCSQAEAAGEPLAVIYLDLDGFKDVNDIFGHGAGDELLIGAARRLRALAGDKGLLGRVGGDEFMILTAGKDAHDMAVQFAESCIAVLEEPVEAAELTLTVSASVGVALGDSTTTGEELHRRADVAMYAAKGEGKKRWRLYDPAMDEGREQRKALENDLRSACATDEIGILFQPIVRASDGVVVCVEALARWRHPTLGMVPPDRFIPIAEESSLIVQLGKRILRDACQTARGWEGVNLAVNLSPAQFWDRSLVPSVKQILSETGFPAHRLELEITESYLTRRPDLAAKLLTELRALGIRVSLDDFGSGFASVGFLQRFELDKIKLDRSYVASIDREGKTVGLMQAMIAVGKALDLPITAEGVETSEQAALLRTSGCAQLQGWLYGRPMSPSEIESRLRQDSRRPALAAAS